jgi:hypothetical protein
MYTGGAKLNRFIEIDKTGTGNNMGFLHPHRCYHPVTPFISNIY